MTLTPPEHTLEAACDRWAERTALTYRGEDISFAGLWDRVMRLAGAYQRLGIGPGDRVLCQLPDCPEHVIAIHSAWACGAVHVGVDNDLTGRELAALARRTQAAALVFQPRAEAPDPLAPVRAVREAFPQTRILLNGVAHQDGGHYPLSDLLTDSEPLRRTGATPLGPRDTALLFLTSGTTSEPKAVKETLPALWAKLRFFADHFSPGPDDVHLMYLPITHAFGFKLTLTALLTGGRVVLLDRFSPAETLRLVTEERVTVLPGTPTHFKLLVDRLDPQRHRVDSLRWGVAAAAALPRLLLEQIYGDLGLDIFYVYGCSEGFLVVTSDREEILQGSVGKAVFRGPEGTPPDGSVAIVSTDDHTPVSPGEVGEIVFGAREPVRYWGHPDAATDGWYHTGDLGRTDREGRLFIVGRLKELVNRGGLKVAPGEVEALLARHPDVADTAVLGTPDAVLGDAVCACIVPLGPHPPDLEAVRSFLAGSLARHKLPDELCRVEQIPRTKIGKVDRQALHALVVGAEPPRERLRRDPEVRAASGSGR